MKKSFCVLFPIILIAVIFCGCSSKAAFTPPEGQEWLEAWLNEEEAIAESVTFRELAESYDWIAEAQILDISPMQQNTITLPNGETWIESYRDYTLNILAAFPEHEAGKLQLHGAFSYSDSKGREFSTPWEQTERDGLALKPGEFLWLYGHKRAQDTAPFSGFPEDGLILVFDERNRLLPCRELCKLAFENE